MRAWSKHRRNAGKCMGKGAPAIFPEDARRNGEPDPDTHLRLGGGHTVLGGALFFRRPWVPEPASGTVMSLEQL